MKISINTPMMESTSAAKDFLSSDGLLDFKKLDTLNKRVEKEVAGYKPTLKEGKVTRANPSPQDTITGIHANNMREVRNLVQGKGTKVTKAKDGSFTVVTTGAKERGLIEALSPKDGLAIKPSLVMAIGIKAKVEEFNAAKNRKKDAFVYQTRRAANVTTRTKETDKMRVFLRQYPKGVLPVALEKQVREAFSALTAHARASVKTKAAVQKSRGVVKDAKATAFSKASDELTSILTSAGFSEAGIVSGKTVMGAQSLFIRLPKSKQVISIGLSDIQMMNKAKKMNSEAES